MAWRNSGNSIGARNDIFAPLLASHFLGETFYALLQPSTDPLPPASDLICQAHRGQVLRQPNNIRRKTAYQIEATQTNAPVRTSTLAFKLLSVFFNIIKKVGTFLK